MTLPQRIALPGANFIVDGAGWNYGDEPGGWFDMEKCAIRLKNQLILVLTDGSGTLEFGYDASLLFVSRLRSLLNGYDQVEIDEFESMLFDANMDTRRELRIGKMADAGFDLIVALLYQKRLIIGWIGSAMGILLNERKVDYITRPHNRAENAIRLGMDRQQVYSDPRSFINTRSFGHDNSVYSYANGLEWSPILQYPENRQRLILISRTAWSHFKFGILELHHEIGEIGNSAPQIIQSAQSSGAHDDILAFLLSVSAS